MIKYDGVNLRDVEENPQFRPRCENVFAVVVRVHDFLRTLTQLVISSQKMDPIHNNFHRLSDKSEESNNLDNFARPHLHQVDDHDYLYPRLAYELPYRGPDLKIILMDPMSDPCGALKK
jgi:hypothetical protein